MTEPVFEHNAGNKVNRIPTNLQNFRFFFFYRDHYGVFVLLACVWVEKWHGQGGGSGNLCGLANWSLEVLGGLGQEPSAALVATGEALRQDHRAFKPHTDQLGATTWSFLEGL